MSSSSESCLAIFFDLCVLLGRSESLSRAIHKPNIPRQLANHQRAEESERKGNGLDVGQNSTLSDGDVPEQLVQLLVVPDGQLEVSGDDALLPVVSSGVAGELEHLSAEVWCVSEKKAKQREERVSERSGNVQA